MDNIPLSYKEQYILIHGYHDLIPEMWYPFKKGETAEDIYREAIERGITWRKLTGWNTDKTGNDL